MTIHLSYWWGAIYTKRILCRECASPMGVAAEASKQAILDTGAGEELERHIDTIVSIRIFPDSFNRPRLQVPFGRAENPPRAVASESVQIQLRLSMAMWGVILPKNTSMRWQREYPTKMLN
ncbi:MAG: hypothetical protein Ct9H90mP25_6410 [Gammaproteobacteria bacterium]|nr:MAG: hypothetical protein Ct9H90mP25_6410 [Gammaproteobacteria bacterium]